MKNLLSKLTLLTIPFVLGCSLQKNLETKNSNNFLENLPEKFLNYKQNSIGVINHDAPDYLMKEYFLDSINGDVLEIYPKYEVNGEKKTSENPAIYYFNLNNDGLFSNENERFDDPEMNGLLK